MTKRFEKAIVNANLLSLLPAEIRKENKTYTLEIWREEGLVFGAYKSGSVKLISKKGDNLNNLLNKMHSYLSLNKLIE